MAYTIAALYHFCPVVDPHAVMPPLEALCRARQLRGTLIIAHEGVNGTIAGPGDGVAAVIEHLRALPGFAGLEIKESHAESAPFRKLKIKVKHEIVTLGAGDVDPTAAVGRYVAPQDWNTLVDDPDSVLIDTRNDYEVALGTFKGAVDPRTASFRDFPAWWAEHGADFEGKKIAMFCTGGIRCEKSTSYLIGQGVEEVYHLKGGILKYLEDVPQAKSRWEGDCFVFDERVSVGHGLVEGPHGLCRACRRPVTQDDMRSPHYRAGVSCPACITEFTDAGRARFAERQLQMDLARARGTAHLAQD